MVVSKKPDGRTWKACLSCRRKKIKCDGENPCHGCQSRGQPCEFPDSNDNASASRRYAASFEERCQHMDALCQRLEGLAETLSNCISAAQRPDQRQQGTFTADPIQDEAERSHLHLNSVADQLSQVGELLSEVSGHGQENNLHSPTYHTPIEPVGHMVADSYGRLRYIGGATNNIMIEAIQSLSPEGATAKPAPSAGDGEVGLPFFIKGQKWPEIPHLPQPKDLAMPPQYVADLLVGIYFDQLHYTFPILYKPDFMRRYQQMKASRGQPPTDRGFLSVFYAVCACASSLLPRPQGSSALPGIEYYHNALLLQFASTGEAFIEQVQCLGLLAFCSAGWNTLSQSWRFAGQAVRMAQDLGLHVSSLKGLSPEGPSRAEYIEAHVLRCIWWSVFGLDCLTSICLGRPMAVDEADCCCELPFDVSSEHLEQYNVPPTTSLSPVAPGSSPMTGFLAFTRLCRISARVHQFSSSIRRGRSDVTADETRFLSAVDALARELDDWLQGLPDEIRFSASLTQVGSNLTMCIVVFIFHAGTFMNLYRPLADHTLKLSLPGNPTSQCITAAQRCIQAAELIRERVPPSHYLAFCVQYLTISGILLLSMADGDKDSGFLPDVQSALRFLGDLEAIWPGARRSRMILDRLLQDPFCRMRGSSVRFPSLPALDGLLWEQFPDSEFFLNTY